MPGLQGNNYCGPVFRNSAAKRSMGDEEVFGGKRAKFDQAQSTHFLKSLPFYEEFGGDNAAASALQSNPENTTISLPAATSTGAIEECQMDTSDHGTASAPSLPSRSDSVLTNPNRVRSFCRPDLDNYYRCNFFHDIYF